MDKLGKKQRVTHESFQQLYDTAQNIIGFDEIRKLASKTVKNIQIYTRTRKAAVCWSGGKDSIVLEHLCRKAGVEQSLLVVCDLEYPEFMEWVSENSPKGLTVINTGQGLDWLVENPHMLFPNDSALSSRWFRQVQHRGQDKYFKEHSVDALILGRRKADGNFFKDGKPAYRNTKTGTVRYCPLMDWSHEQLFAYIKHFKLSLPPIYNWSRGYTVGTGPWAKRKVKTQWQGWEEIYSIDPSIVEKAAEVLPDAHDYICHIKQKG